ncbi:MAG: NAD(P)/FAD-dependent oxidoreductase [Deltaproteobacteria bacterium]|nr:NAD(P)/FAD-dependent oxidoreductase [Deltaproteobacteria bacterium]
MREEHCVVIGNGPAGNEAATTVREHAPDVRITVIGQETVHQYKPNLLPDYIAGKISYADLFVTDPGLYKERDIKLRLGQRVASVDFRNSELILDHHEKIRFTGLIIACGARPRIPEPLQVFEDLLLTLKTVADAEVWIEKLVHVEDVLIAGGDLTSLCFTKALLSLGKRVIFVLSEDSFWPVRITPEVREQCAQKLREAGVDVTECRKIKGLARVSEHSVEVRTDTKTMVVGAVGAFYGLVPDVRFLARSGLDIERGILVDEHLKTCFDHVYAAGDCAQVFHPALKDYWVSIGRSNAVELGKVAAVNLLGGVLSVDVPRENIFELDGIIANTSWWLEF